MRRTIFIAIFFFASSTVLLLAAYSRGTWKGLPSSQETQTLINQFPQPPTPDVPAYRTTWPTPLSPRNKWITYSSNVLNVSVKYPPELTIGTEPSADASPNISIGVYPVTDEGTKGTFEAAITISVTDVDLPFGPRVKNEKRMITSNGLIEYEDTLLNPPPQVFYRVQCLGRTVDIEESIGSYLQAAPQQQQEYYNMLRDLADSITCNG